MTSRHEIDHNPQLHFSDATIQTLRSAEKEAIKYGYGGFEHILLSEEEAMRWGHGFALTEHILLAILNDPTTKAHQLIATKKDPQLIRGCIEFMIKTHGNISDQRLGLTANVKEIIELAEKEARKEGGTSIDPEHLLFAIIRSQSLMSTVLELVGITEEDLPELRKKATESASHQDPDRVLDLDRLLKDLHTILNDASVDPTRRAAIIGNLRLIANAVKASQEKQDPQE